MVVSPYVISGIVRSGPDEGYDELNTTIGSGGGDTVDLYLNSGTSLVAGLTVYIIDITNGQVVSTTTNGAGEYSYDLTNLSTEYAVGNSIRVWCSDITATRQFDTTASTGVVDSTSINKPEAHEKPRRILKAGREGKEHTEDYPENVLNTGQYISYENPSWVGTYTSGVIATETITRKGKTYRKTYTWSSGTLTKETAWFEV